MGCKLFYATFRMIFFVWDSIILWWKEWRIMLIKSKRLCKNYVIKWNSNTYFSPVLGVASFLILAGWRYGNISSSLQYYSGTLLLTKIIGKFGQKYGFFSKWEYFVKISELFVHFDENILIWRKLEKKNRLFLMIFVSVRCDGMMDQRPSFV